MAAHCPHCGQKMPAARFGIAFPPLKVRLIDAIKRAGADGIAADDLFRLCFDDDRKRSRATLKSHIAQVNDLLAATDFRIRSIHRRYVLKREPL